MREEITADFLKVLGHPSRIKILTSLENGSRCVRDLESVVGITQSNLSQHLRILKDKGILEHERRGTEICYWIKNRNALDIIRFAEKLFTERG